MTLVRRRLCGTAVLLVAAGLDPPDSPARLRAAIRQLGKKERSDDSRFHMFLGSGYRP